MSIVAGGGQTLICKNEKLIPIKFDCMKKTENIYVAFECLNDEAQIRIASMEKAINRKELKQIWNHYNELGLDALIKQVDQVISCALKRLADAPCGERVQKSLTDSDAFQNPAFGSFLIYLLNACKIVYQDYDDYESGIPDAMNMARLELYTLPYNEVTRKEAEDKIFSNIDCDLFVRTFAESVPKVLTLSQFTKTGRPS